jgi:Ca2+-transporting ATPase
MAVFQGLSVLAVCLGIFLATRDNHGPDAARALVFSCMVVSFVAVILMNRSWTRTSASMLREPNVAVWWVIGGTCGFLALVILVPGVRRVFEFAPLHTADLVLSLLGGIACLVWFDLLKLWRSRGRSEGHPTVGAIH